RRGYAGRGLDRSTRQPRHHLPQIGGTVAEYLSDEDANVYERLSKELGAAQHKFATADRYYDGVQFLEQLGLAIPEELMRFTVIVNWPRVVVDATADRLDVKGFRLAGEE